MRFRVPLRSVRARMALLRVCFPRMQCSHLGGDLSPPPSKCEHGVLGKQTCNTVPAVREGVRASRQLERVYVDLCGPMSIPSHSGRLYPTKISHPVLARIRSHAITRTALRLHCILSRVKLVPREEEGMRAHLPVPYHG